MSQEPSGLCWWLFSPAEFLAPGEHLLCSHMSELAAWVGLCRSWAGKAAAHSSGGLAPLPTGGTPAHGRLCEAMERPWLGLKTDLVSVFILLGAGCVTLGKILALSEPQLLHLRSGDSHCLGRVVM